MAKLLIYNKGSSNVHRLDCGANSSAPTIKYENGSAQTINGDIELYCQDKRAKSDILITHGGSIKRLNCADKRFTTNIITSYHNPFDSNLSVSEKLSAVVTYTNMYYNGTINLDQLSDYFAPGDTITGVTIGNFLVYANNYYATSGNAIRVYDFYSNTNTNATLVVLGVGHDNLSNAYGSARRTKAAVTFMIRPYIYSGSPYLYRYDGDYVWAPTTANGLCYTASINYYADEFTDSNEGNFGWSTSSEHGYGRITHLNNTFPSAVPSELQGYVKQVVKKTMDWNSNGTFISSVDDYAFLLSATEYAGDAAVGFNEGCTRYAYFANNGYIEDIGWTRSVNGHQSQFYYNTQTNSIQTANPRQMGFGHAYCFCI